MSGFPGSPPYVSWPPGPPQDPTTTTTKTPPQTTTSSTGEFATNLTVPIQIQVGGSGRFTGYFAHVTDGPLGGVSNPWTTGPTLAILDGNGIAVPTGVIQGVIIGTVTATPANSGTYISVVQLGASLQPGTYVAAWTGSYTPVNTQEPAVALPISVRKRFSVVVTKQDSRFFFATTAKFG